MKEDEVIPPTGAVPGDVVILTKPLGTQVAVNVHSWLEDPARFEKVRVRGYALRILFCVCAGGR